MASVVLTGDTSGTLTVSAPLVAGSNTQTLVAVTGTLAPVVSGTVVTSTSGTVADFTGIPSWVKKITVMFSGVSSNGASQFQVQLGTTSGVEATGYASAGCRPSAVQTSTTGLLVQYDNNSTWTTSGILTIGLIGSNSWTSSGTSYSETGSLVHYFAGRKALAGTLDRVRFTTVNGTDTFDAGTINILYE
jgi:hypothetical protein